MVRVVFFVLCLICATVYILFAEEGQTPVSFAIKMKVDLGTDLGQNFGTLFEMTDPSGRVVAGAGYEGVYNTESRSDRRMLQFFVRPKTPTVQIERLPRANDDAGVYLHTFDNRIFARSRAGAHDSHLRVWDVGAQKWTIDTQTTPFSIHVGNGVLAVGPRQVTYDNRTVLNLTRGAIGPHYYANGFFIFRHYDTESDPPLNHLIACAWRPGEQMDLKAGHTLVLRTPGEFIYAFGQLGPEVLAISNIGGIYRFDKRDWTVLREPVLTVSFQVYSILNYYDRLLLGHYPTGELYEYAGEDLQLLKGSPPVMEGVSTRAREAQTMAIYGGDLYVGVWPWAEVWRFDRQAWTFVSRMFSHPEPTDATVHPYENETRALDEVLNRWGQRVTSLIPHENALYLSTSAKGSFPYEPKFTFLAEDRWKDYGAIYRLKTPGHLSVQTRWVDGPTQFEFIYEKGTLRVLQDGTLLGATDVLPPIETIPKEVVWGMGIFGPCNGLILDRFLQTN